MAAELIAFGVGANWITKLYKKLRRIQKKREDVINKINNELFMDPLELVKYYVEPDCQEINPADRHEEKFQVSREPVYKKVDEFLRAKKADEPGDRHMFVLSDAGMGKTSLLIMLRLLHLISFWPKNIDCVLKKLGKETITEINEIEDKRKTFLLLDALDEDPLAYGRVEERLLEILDATKSFYRVILTCRTQFFPIVEKDPYERPGLITVAGYVCPSKYLSLFDDDKVDSYLDKRFPKKMIFFKQEKEIGKAKILIDKMGSLRCRPMLLSYIDNLMESPLSESKINEYNIYKSLVDSWLLREQRKSKVQKSVLLKSCGILAVEMYKNNERDIPEADLDNLIAGISELENVKAIDVKGRSLLNRNSEGHYRFSHYSIQEFLVVRYFVDNPGIRLEKKLRTTDNIVQMLLDSFEENRDHIENFDLRNTILQSTALQDAKKIYKNEKGHLEAEFTDGLVMVYIPAGEFTMGSNEGIDREEPVHKVFLDGYWIGKYPVTFEQYDRYCDETGKDKPDDAGWGRGKRPVINVSWEDACAFCEWLKKKTRLSFNLPTEAQWEKAARGTEGLVYPWGNTFDKNKCNSGESGLKKTSPVGKFPGGVSPYGCLDMAGNVWEWCADWFDENYYKVSPDRNPPGPGSGAARVVRGGSWGGSAGSCRAAFRSDVRPAVRHVNLGFRLAASL